LIAIDNPNRRDMLILQLKHRLALEMKGLKTRGRSAYALAKEVLNIRGSRQFVLDQLQKEWEAILDRRSHEAEEMVAEMQKRRKADGLRSAD